MLNVAQYSFTVDTDLKGQKGEGKYITSNCTSYRLLALHFWGISHLIMKRQVVFDESEHVDLKASHVAWVANPLVSRDVIKCDLVIVGQIRAANCKAMN